MSETATPPKKQVFPETVVFTGYAAPSRVEGHVRDLEVIGEIPPELDGAFYRNSGDHAHPPLFDNDIFINGDGMVHMVRFERGHADLTTRFVRTRKFELERKARRALFGQYRNPFTNLPEVRDEDLNTANTSIMFLNNKLYALKESGRPYEIDPETLETLGETDFDGQLKSRTFTAHPKVDPVTGETIAFGYNCEGVPSNDIEIYTIDKSGTFTRSERFEAPYSSMVHDFLVSRNHIAFVICPMVCNWDWIQRGESYWKWDSKLSVHVAVIPRDQGVSGIRWFTAPKIAMQTHTFNAWEDGSKLVLDQFVAGSGWLSQFPDIHDPNAKELPPFAERWTLDLASDADEIHIERLMPSIGEMPAIDQRFAMGRVRQFWFGCANPAMGPMLAPGPKGPPFTCLGHFNETTGETKFFYAGPDSAPEEPVFVPRSADGAEGDGWLLSMVGRRAENRTDLVILDAMHLDRGPVATVKLPFRIREGIHGLWLGAKALGW